MAHRRGRGQLGLTDRWLESLYRAQERGRQWIVGRGYRLRGLIESTRNAGVDRPAAERVVFVLTGLLGDTVMCTPALIAAREIWPSAELTVLAMRHNRELLDASPVVDRLVESSAFPYSIRRAGEVRRLRDQLSAERFDVAIILLGDQFASTLAEAGIPIRVGVRGHPLEPCLTHAYELGPRRSWGPHQRVNSLRVLGFDVPTPAPRLWVSEHQRDASERALEALDIGARERYVVVHPFGSSRRQWWPPGRLRELSREVLAAAGMRTLVIGRPPVPVVLEAPAGGPLIDAMGAFQLPALVAVIERASAVITTDSGPYHIAGALGRPVVGLFRAIRPEYAGLYSTAKVLLGSSARCDRECAWERCSAFPCRQMASLSVPEVSARLNAQLGGTQ